ncbi:hypothetical protein [Pseudovibrio sp. POLY-S9]|uniref:hypothetical protein n=1 Tax=Pseudovibrio sp. POLY-S9 TaxID=1576596 RepID=UPI00128F7E14|nr:hypothetical protein [Pseudovibrio sp. POLY-S9]
MSKGFAKQVGAWAKDIPEALEVVYKESLQRLSHAADDRLGEQLRSEQDKRKKAITNFLRSSAVMRINQPLGDVTEPAKGGAYSPAEFDSTLASVKFGDSVTFGFTAVYAMRYHFGFSGVDSLGRNINQPARPFLQLEAQNWQKHVEAAAKEVKARLKL